MLSREMEKHNAIEINLQKVGLIPNAGGVYFLCNKGEIIYIGTSDNLRVRICSHMPTKEIDRVFFLIYEGYIRRHHEKQFIRQYQPKFNCFHTYPAIKKETPMIKYRLNKEKIETEMERSNLNLSDLARRLGWSRQLTHHAINHGSKSFAPKIAAALGIEPESIIISIRRGGDRVQTGRESRPSGASGGNL